MHSFCRNISSLGTYIEILTSAPLHGNIVPSSQKVMPPIEATMPPKNHMRMDMAGEATFLEIILGVVNIPEGVVI